MIHAIYRYNVKTTDLKGERSNLVLIDEFRNHD